MGTIGTNRRRPQIVATAVLFLLVAMNGSAWDEVSHAYIVESAIELVQDEELRTILSEHHAIVRFGSWFPDWGQYGDHPFNDGSHREVLAAYFDYVRSPQARASEDYPQLLAHFMGAYAHIVQDFFLDSTIYTYMRELDNGMSNDMENGMMNIRLHGYLTLSVDAAYAYDHLKRVYESIGYFDRDEIDPAEFRKQIDHHTRIQFLQLRALKLLSFLASDYVQSLMPWGAENMLDAPGGISDNARATARVWESLWQEIQGREAPLFVYSLPRDGGVIPSPDNESMYGRITLVATHAIDPAKLGPEAITLRDDGGRRIHGEAGVYAYDADGYSFADLALQFIPGEPLEPGRSYTLTVAPGEYGVFERATTEGYEIAFSAPSIPDTSAPSRRFGLRMGIFLFILLAALGGIFFGLPGALALRREAVPAARTLAVLVLRRSIEVLGVAVAAVGIVMLVTRGRAFIELLLDIF